MKYLINSEINSDKDLPLPLTEKVTSMLRSEELDYNFKYEYITKDLEGSIRILKTEKINIKRQVNDCSEN